MSFDPSAGVLQTEAEPEGPDSSGQPFFPVVYSTLAGESLKTQILSQYDLPPIHHCYLWNRGLSDVYWVETVTQPYILRISHHHWRSRSDVDFEMEWLEFLRQRQLPIAYPLKTRHHQFTIPIHAPEGDRYASLFVHAPGDVPLGDLNPTQAEILGAVLGRIHQATPEFQTQKQRQALTLEYLLQGAERDIAPFLQHRPDDVAYLHEVVTDLMTQLQDLPQEFPYWVVCWGDPHSGNAHFTPENRVTLFDFDQCAYGWRIFELAKFLEIALRIGTIPKVREAFFSGYQAVNPLQPFELKVLQPMTQMAHLWVWWISLTAARLHSYSRLDDHYFRSRLERLKRLRAPEWQLF